MNILFIHNRQVRNLGDRAILAAMISQMRRIFPGCRIAISTSESAMCRHYFPECEVFPGIFDAETKNLPTKAAAGARTALNALPRFLRAYLLEIRIVLRFAYVSLLARLGSHRIPVLGEYRRADLLLSVGGDFFSGTYGCLGFVSREIGLAKALGKPVIIYAQSIGPFSGGDIKRARKYLNMVDLILARDQETAELLTRYGVRAPVEVTADCAVILEPVINQKVRETVRRYGLGSNSVGFALLEERFTNLAAATYGAYVLGMTELIRHARRAGYSPILIVAGPADASQTEAMKRRLGDDTPVFNALDLEPSEVKAVFSHMRALVSSRMHPIIIGTSAGTPAMGVGKLLKMNNYLRAAGLEEYYISMVDFDLARAKALFDKLVGTEDAVSRLRERLPVLSARSEDNVVRVKAFFQAYEESRRQDISAEVSSPKNDG